MLDSKPNERSGQSEPTIDEMWVLAKVLVPSLYTAELKYVVGAKRSWMNLSDKDKAEYLMLAEHTDKEVLVKMKQLAIEGDQEGRM